MNEIKTVKSTDELKRLFDFLSITFYEDAAEYGEHYFAMSERYEEMKKQFEADKDFLMYIESNDKIVAGITGKNMTDDRITIGVLAVDKSYRRKGLAKQLVLEFENKCRTRNIKHISLGARFRACRFYQSLDYHFSLLIQVYDFANIDDIRNNKYDFIEKASYQGDAYGFIIYKVPDINEEYIGYFEKNVKTAQVQYIFDKYIE